MDVNFFESRRQVKRFAETLEDGEIHVEDLEEQVDGFNNCIATLTQELEQLTAQRNEVAD